MYEVKFAATDDADWAQSIALFDDDTGEPLDTTDMDFVVGVSQDGLVLLSASTVAGTIETPETGVIQWRFTSSQLGTLSTGTTYNVGCTVETTDGVTQVFTGTLAFIDGSVP